MKAVVLDTFNQTYLKASYSNRCWIYLGSKMETNHQDNIFIFGNGLHYRCMVLGGAKKVGNGFTAEKCSFSQSEEEDIGYTLFVNSTISKGLW